MEIGNWKMEIRFLDEQSNLEGFGKNFANHLTAFHPEFVDS